MIIQRVHLHTSPSLTIIFIHINSCASHHIANIESFHLGLGLARNLKAAGSFVGLYLKLSFFCQKKDTFHLTFHLIFILRTMFKVFFNVCCLNHLINFFQRIRKNLSLSTIFGVPPEFVYQHAKPLIS